ncbi:MAG: hypothetical protein ABUT20_43360, partial [Bacteroidota bacterium]
SILEPAATAVAEIAWFIENKGLSQTGKKFVNDAFLFFKKLSDETLEHKSCSYARWKVMGYRVSSPESRPFKSREKALT